MAKNRRTVSGRLKSRNSKKAWEELPKNIKVGYADFKIIGVSENFVCEKNESLLGECDTENSQIRVTPHQGKQEFANTVLHELLHAICWTQGLKLSEKNEEAAVTNITNGLALLIRDNPDLLRWLRKNLK